MKIKSLKEHNNYNFDIKITLKDVSSYLNLQERISTLAFIIYEKEWKEEYPEDGNVNWNETFIDEIYSGDSIDVVLIYNGDNTPVSVPTELIFNPSIIDEYIKSEKYNL